MSKKLHVIILAAGKGSRLAGVMPPYFKPLMTINGECLLVRTVRQVHDVFTGADYDLTIVAAPENTLPICQVLNDAQMAADVVVQRQPAGPGAAVLRALNDAQTTLVLMGDNLMERQAIFDVAAIDSANPTTCSVGGAYGVGNVENLTRFRQHAGNWVEKVSQDDVADAGAFAWIGPIRCETTALRDALNAQPFDDRAELPIGPIFNELKPKLVEVDCTDIGVITP